MVSPSTGDDFLILQDGDTPRPVEVAQRTVIVTSQSSLEFMRAVWDAHVALLLILVPTLIAMLLSHLLFYADIEGSLQNHVGMERFIVSFLLFVAVFIGLPIHLIVLEDLDEAVFEAEQKVRGKDAATQADPPRETTSDATCDTSDESTADDHHSSRRSQSDTVINK